MRERSDRHEWLIKRAKRYALSGNSAAVEEVMLQLLRDEPDDTVALGMLGAAQFQSGRPALAVKTFRHALQLDPDLAIVRYQLGLAHAALAEHDKALESWRPLLGDDDEFMAFYQSGLALVALGRESEAASLFQTAYERMPQEHPLAGSLSQMTSRYAGEPGQTH